MKAATAQPSQTMPNLKRGSFLVIFACDLEAIGLRVVLFYSNGVFPKNSNREQRTDEFGHSYATNIRIV
jgi:hypothetical protein